MEKFIPYRYVLQTLITNYKTCHRRQIFITNPEDTHLLLIYAIMEPVCMRLVRYLITSYVMGFIRYTVLHQP